MSQSDTISDETLMAYADAQLEPAARLEVERALANDAGLAARLQQYQRLSGRVQAAYNSVLSEPVPSRLVDMLRAPSTEGASSPASAPSGNARPGARSFSAGAWLHEQTAKLLGDWAWPQWSAAAASLAVAVAIGALLSHENSGGLMQLESGRLLARGGLATALTTQAAGPQAAGSQSANSQVASIQMNLSFRNRSGEYCRAFNVREARPAAGVACRRGGDWQIDVLTPGTAREGDGFRQAGSALPAPVLSAIGQQISGEPLDAAGEAQALRQGWK